MKKMCKDHLGNKFNSITEMCKHWGIRVMLYQQRVKLGWSLEKCLTFQVKVVKKPFVCKDHLGNDYTSITNMCEHYHINPCVFRNRLKKGWGLEKSLTEPVVKYKKGVLVKDLYKDGKILDHLGHEFSSCREMFDFWDVSSMTFWVRIKNGWSLEKALTSRKSNMGKQNSKVCYDHLGNMYPSKKAMCEHWGIPYDNYCARIRLGWSLEKSLSPLCYSKNTNYHLELRKGY